VLGVRWRGKRWARGEGYRDKMKEYPVGSASSLVLVGLALILIYWSACDCTVKSPPQTVTRAAVWALDNCIVVYYDIHGSLPCGTSADIVRILVSEGLIRPRLGDCDALGNLLDGWGSPISISITEQGRRFTIRSLGPNKKDDNGQGDDMEEIYVFDDGKREWLSLKEM
jgi:hypothetical protein